MRNADTPDDPYRQMEGDTKKQLIDSGALYYLAIENADGVPFRLIFGPQPGEGYYLNLGKSIKQLTGIPLEEFTEKVFQGLVEKVVPLSSDIPSELSESRRKFINGELKSYKAEILIRLPEGEKKWIKDCSLPLIDEETGKVIGAFGILFDINERKQTIMRLEDAKEKAEESDKLKSAFLHNISHEIRTPLNAIVGFSTILNDSDEDRGDRDEIKNIISRSSDHLLEIVDDIVEISNIEANNVKIRKEEININLALRKVYDRFREKARDKNISLGYTTALDDNEVNILTDGYKLSKVLTNLISNALKFTKEGEVRFGYSVKNNKLEFFISDTGIGIPEVHHAMIFNSFYQADSSNTRRYEGTGLGLSISKAYIQLLGGEIWFNSQPDKGSEFYFTVPIEKVGA